MSPTPNTGKQNRVHVSNFETKSAYMMNLTAETEALFSTNSSDGTLLEASMPNVVGKARTDPAKSIGTTSHRSMANDADPAAENFEMLTKTLRENFAKANGWTEQSRVTALAAAATASVVALISLLNLISLRNAKRSEELHHYNNKYKKTIKKRSLDNPELMEDEELLEFLCRYVHKLCDE